MYATGLSTTVDVYSGTQRNEKIDALRVDEQIGEQVRYLRSAGARFGTFYTESCQSKIHSIPLVAGISLQYAWRIVKPCPVSMYRDLWVPLHTEVFCIIDSHTGTIIRHRLMNTWDYRGTHDATMDKTVLVIDGNQQWGEDCDQARKARIHQTVQREGLQQDSFEVLLSELVTTMEFAEERYFGSVSTVPSGDAS